MISGQLGVNRAHIEDNKVDFFKVLIICFRNHIFQDIARQAKMLLKDI